MWSIHHPATPYGPRRWLALRSRAFSPFCRLDRAALQCRTSTADGTPASGLSMADTLGPSFTRSTPLMATATASLKRMYIDGKWTAAANGRTLGVINPATEEVIEEIAYGGRAELRQALEAAQRAMPAWMKLTAWDRAKVLKKTADLMRERLDTLARTLTMEQGKPLAESKAEILHSADTFEWFGEEGKRAYGQVIPQSQPGKKHVTLKHPVGVVGAISPWNFPITLQSRKIAPALAARCTIVTKPASQTPPC